MPKGLRLWWAHSQMAWLWMVVMGMSSGQTSICELWMFLQALIRMMWSIISCFVAARTDPFSRSMMRVGVPNPAKTGSACCSANPRIPWRPARATT